MNSQDEFLKFLLNEFINEAKDSMEEWGKICLQMETEFSVTSCHSLFRIAHNLKGSSLTVGLKDFADFIKKIEVFITAVKKGEIEFSETILSIFLDSKHVLELWIKKLPDEPVFEKNLSPKHIEERLKKFGANSC